MEPAKPLSSLRTAGNNKDSLGRKVGGTAAASPCAVGDLKASEEEEVAHLPQIAAVGLLLLKPLPKQGQDNPLQ